MSLNSRGHKRKYSLICANWYEITRSASLQLLLHLPVCCICSVSVPIPLDSLEIKTQNCCMNRPPLSLSHRYKERMDFHQKIFSIAFSFLIGNKKYKCYLLSLSAETQKAADILLCKGSFSKYYDLK